VPESEFYLEPRIGEQEANEQAAYMLDEENIEAVIKSWQDLSASGADGISYRIIKGMKGERVKLIRILVDTYMRNGKISKTGSRYR
jgi:hypothetical protein